MRRRVDSYLNATQILKVAGFDKPQRTRILEREVQKGDHEKVQGGYGKYQGEHRRRNCPSGLSPEFCPSERYLDPSQSRYLTLPAIQLRTSSPTYH